MSAAATTTSFLPVATPSTVSTSTSSCTSSSATPGPSRFLSPSTSTFSDYSRPRAYPFFDGSASAHASSSSSSSNSRTQYRSRSSPRLGSTPSSPPPASSSPHHTASAAPSSPPFSAAPKQHSDSAPPLSPTSSSAHSTASSSSIRSASSRRSSMVASSSSATSSSSSTGGATSTTTLASSVGSSRPSSVSSKGGQAYKIGAMSALETAHDGLSSRDAQASAGDDAVSDTLHGESRDAKGEKGEEAERDDPSAPMDISTLSVREDDDDDDDGDEDEQSLQQRQARVPVGDGWDTPARTPLPEEKRGDAGSGAIASGDSGSKTRRASVLSSSSSSTTAASSMAATTPADHDGSATGTPSGDGTPGQSGAGRRKVARLGSFHGTTGTAAVTTEEQEPKRIERRGGDTPMSSTQADQPSADPAASASRTKAPPPTVAPSAHHVDIVSYPSSDLLRLLAALLEQIAHANDERNARVAAAAAAPPAAVPSQSTIVPGQDTEMRLRPEDGVAAGVAMQQQDSQSGDAGQADSDWRRGRFDAAPLNSPMTPRHRKRHPHPGGPGGPGILDNALDRDGMDDGERDDESAEEDNVGAEMPLTPGMDLLRETASGGGVAGFMPSLGGTHQPQPLSRRRGSSFLRNKRNDDGTIPLATRRTSNFNGGAPPASSAGSNLPSSAPSSRPGTASNVSSGSSSPAAAMRPSPTPGGSTPTGSSNPVVQNETPLSSLLTASAVAFSSPNATLCFHARNVPSISIEAYLQRILKYCPTTNEVFLALLVYFDRMARIGLEAQRLGLPKDHPAQEPETNSDGPNLNKLFAIDSFNVHRLVIAGVTVASKFFSDVFYTNSRYAKVGGLPLHELNQLELQFLLLNDFRLKIPVDELQRYADQLILYWVGRNGTSNPAAAATASSSRSSSDKPSPRVPAVPQPAPPPQPMPVSTAPSARIETPPLTRSGRDAASSQTHTTEQNDTRNGTPSHAPPSYPAHLAHSSKTPDPRSGDSQDTPSVRPFATGSYGGPASAIRSSSSTRPSPQRPQSIRSHPSTSSSFSSSTVTPGTPSTTRTIGSSGRSSDEEYAATDRSGYGDAMDED